MYSKHFVKLLGLLVALLPLQLWSSNLYILFDSGCMDRLEYSYQNLNGGKPYIVYHVNAGPTEKIVLEIGSETQSLQRDLPGQLIKCDNAIFDRRLVKEINSKIDQIFMVVQKNKRYYVSPVRFAAYYRYTGNDVTYLSPKYSFNFDYQKATIGENISYNNPQAEVYFEGQMESDCSGQLLFRQISDNSGEPLTDLVFIPELGIIEERSGLDVEDALNNTLRLKEVNGKTLSRYLRELCEDEVASLAPEFVPKNVPESASINQPIPQSSIPQSSQLVPADIPVDMEVSDGIHLVKKGETLYGISKKHGISLSQIKDWNNIGKSNIIYRGDRLRVIAPVRTAALTDTRGVQEYDQVAARRIIPYEGSQKTGLQPGDKVHIVKTGETVPYLAMKYGFTEAKFRQINNLAKNEFVRIGQPLKIEDCDCPQVSELVVPTEFSTVARTPTGRTNYETSYQARVSDYEAQVQARAPKSNQTVDSRSKNIPTFYGTDPLQAASNQTITRYADPRELEPIDDTVPQSFDFVPKSYDARPPGQRTVHQVMDGETLYKIARDYGTTVQRLRDINNLEANEVLIPYQRIFIN